MGWDEVGLVAGIVVVGAALLAWLAHGSEPQKYPSTGRTFVDILKIAVILLALVSLPPLLAFQLTLHEWAQNAAQLVGLTLMASFIASLRRGRQALIAFASAQDKIVFGTALGMFLTLASWPFVSDSWHRLIWYGIGGVAFWLISRLFGSETLKTSFSSPRAAPEQKQERDLTTE